MFLDLVSDPFLQFKKLSLSSPACHLNYKWKVAHIQYHRESLVEETNTITHTSLQSAI